MRRGPNAYLLPAAMHGFEDRGSGPHAHTHVAWTWGGERFTRKPAYLRWRPISMPNAHEHAQGVAREFQGAGLRPRGNVYDAHACCSVGRPLACEHRKEGNGVSAYRRSVGELLRRHRLTAGLSQEALAERAGLSRRGVSDIERGLIGAPHLDTLTRLADALELPPAERNALQVSARAQRIPQVAEHAQPLRAAVPIQPALVGRQQEFALIERHLAGGAAPLLALAGEPGIGKSRLLAETASRASSQGWRVIAGGCTRRSGQAP